ncbi:class I SAM-dependent methyltransferase [Glycomyces tarimensis]
MRKSDRTLLIELQNSLREMAATIGELRASQDAMHERLEAVEKRAERQARSAYAQIEDMTALYRDIDAAGSLPRMRGWAAGPELLRFLYEEILDHKRARVLECGSGTTTVIMAYAMRSLGFGKVTALEHDPHYADLARLELTERGLAEWGEVVDAPLSDVEIDGEVWRWYDPLVIHAGELDLLVVDGPPGATGPLARYPALPVLADRLAEHALVVLDDADRPDERAIARRWTERFPRFQGERLGHSRGTFLLRRAVDGQGN